MENEFERKERADRVRTMFDAIAPSYDLLNHLLSAGIDQQWRKLAVRCATLAPGESALDLCGGTGDVAVELKKVVGAEGRVVVADFSPSMLAAGAEKFTTHGLIPMVADALNLPFDAEEFSAVTVAFGLRNIVDPARALREMTRVVKPGGRVVVLELAQPNNTSLAGRALKWAYLKYFQQVLPTVGKVISGHGGAYTYLPDSVMKWISREQLTKLMLESGLSEIRTIDCTLGIVCIHVGTRPRRDRQNERLARNIERGEQE